MQKALKLRTSFKRTFHFEVRVEHYANYELNSIIGD